MERCTKYPEYAAKSLELAEKNAAGPAKAEPEIPKGAFVGAVLVNRDTHERIDVSDRVKDKNALKCQVPKGNWKIMAFYLSDAFRPSARKRPPCAMRSSGSTPNCSRRITSASSPGGARRMASSSGDTWTRRRPATRPRGYFSRLGSPSHAISILCTALKSNSYLSRAASQ